MINPTMDAFEFSPRGSADASIIWMHGLGAAGDDFVDILDKFSFEGFNPRFIFPNAPIRAVTCNNGLKMRAWYDIKNFEEIIQDNQQSDSHQGLIESQQLINSFIQREMDYGIPSHKIILVGFSQGGALALQTGLRFPIKLGGIACLSGYLPWEHLLSIEQHPANQATKVFMAHGMLDPVIPIYLAQHSCDVIKNLNYDIAWHVYSMPHTIIENEIVDLNNFFNKVLID